RRPGTSERQAASPHHGRRRGFRERVTHARAGGGDCVHCGKGDREGHCDEGAAGKRRGEGMTLARGSFVVRLLGVLCVLCGGCLAAGCGYTLAGRGSFLPTTIQTIGIPTFAN